MKILFATTNKAKVARVQKLTQHLGIEWLTPIDLGLELVDIEEGSDLGENAKLKALAYRRWTKLPIVGTDTGLHIEGESLDPTKPKRNALGDTNEKSLTQEEIAKKFHSFYRALVKRRGGAVPAWWEDAYAVSLPDGRTVIEHARRDVVLTDKIHGPVDPRTPLRCMYIVQATGKYVADQTDEEEVREMTPVKQALERLIKNI